MFRIGLRMHLWAIIGWGGFLALFGIFEATSYTQLTGGSLANRLAFSANLHAVGQATSLLIATPEHLETLAGYLQWFLFGYIPIFFSIWAMVAGTGAMRGDEERGLVEQWLGAGLTRWRYVLERQAAFATALVIAMSTVGLVALGAAFAAGQRDLPFAGVLLQGIAVVAPCLAIYSIGLIWSNLMPTRRDALGATAVTFVFLLLLNGYSRRIDWVKPFRWISPFAYADRSDAMVPGGHFDLAATAAVILFAVALGVLSALLLARRDLGSATLAGGRGHEPAVLEPATNPLLRWPAIAALWDTRVGLSVWCAGLFCYGLIEMGIVKPFVEFFRREASSSSAFSQAGVFGASGADPVAGFVGTTVYLPILAFLAAYAITQVSRWASEDSEGRLEMVLSAGVERWRVILERFVSLTLGALLILAATHLGIMAGAEVYGLSLPWRGQLLATAMVLPVVLAFGALGAAIAAFRPRLAMIGLSFMVLYAYMAPLTVPPIFAPHPPPSWILNLSLFHLYGAPLTDGISWTGLYGLAAIAAGGLAITFRSMARREVGS